MTTPPDKKGTIDKKTQQQAKRKAMRFKLKNGLLKSPKKMLPRQGPRRPLPSNEKSHQVKMQEAQDEIEGVFDDFAEDHGVDIRDYKTPNMDM